MVALFKTAWQSVRIVFVGTQHSASHARLSAFICASTTLYRCCCTETVTLVATSFRYCWSKYIDVYVWKLTNHCNSRFRAALSLSKIFRSSICGRSYHVKELQNANCYEIVLLSNKKWPPNSEKLLQKLISRSRRSISSFTLVNERGPSSFGRKPSQIIL